MSKTCAVILAAGEGKRMKSNKPKALAEVLFKPMLDWVLDTTAEAGITDTCLVVGHFGDQLTDYVGDKCTIAWQKERLGTGHAVMQAMDFLRASSAEDVLILNGDAPFMDADSMLASLDLHKKEGNSVTVIAARIADPTGYGRIIRNEDGSLARITEQKDATAEELKIQEVNSGGYWFRREDLMAALQEIKPENAAHEYYLTDTIYVLKHAGKKAGVYATENGNVILGANDRLQLQQLNEIARKEIIEKHLLNGVDIPCTDGVMIGPDAVIGNETQILPNTIIKGKSTIGSNCVLGPNTFVVNGTIADGVTLNNIMFEDSSIGAGADMGPFSHVRPNCHLGEAFHAGNFVELKNSNIGNGTKVPHLTYVGDSDVGEGCNFGCGSLTVNYDGKIKHRTTIGDHVFVGCNTNLVAPVTVGDWAYTAAGSTITEDVPENALAIARSRQENKEHWVTKQKPYKNMK